MTSLELNFGGRTNPLEIAQSLRSGVVSLVDQVFTAEPVVVEKYTFKTQRVDVRLKNFPKMPTLLSIPISWAGGKLRIITPLKRGDVGLLIFPRSDSRKSWNDTRIDNPTTTRFHLGYGPIFIPGISLLNQTQPALMDESAGASNLDKLGPNDSAIMFQDSNGVNKSYILFKESGEVIIRGSKIYVGDISGNVSAFDAVARTGDAVSGGAISGGSAKVFASD